MSIKLRFIESKSRTKSYYFGIHHNSERWREFVKFNILNKDAAKSEKLRVIEKIRLNRELELLSDDTGYIPQQFKKT